MTTKYLTEDYTLDTSEAASLLNYHPQYVRILARTGKLPAVKVLGSWRFCRQQILDGLREGTRETIKANMAKTNLDERTVDDQEGLAEKSDLFQ